jgi:hypothetical protein
MQMTPTTEQLNKALQLGFIKPGDFWAGLPEYPQYLIGMHGAVLSFVKDKPRLLRGGTKGKYRSFVLLDQTGQFRWRYLHHLVAEIAYGPRPSGLECCHNDGDRFNNDCQNLRWDTHAANELDKRAHGQVCLSWRAQPDGEANEAGRRRDARDASNVGHALLRHRTTIRCFNNDCITGHHRPIME